MISLLPAHHPAVPRLAAEGLSTTFASPGGTSARPLRIALLDLMPDKQTTDLQFARLLAGAGRPVELTCFLPPGYVASHTAPGYIEAFYADWSAVQRRRFDGLIVTGAPLEHLPWRAVRYWQALTEILDWAARTGTRTLAICWAAQAALQHFHGIDKRPLGHKLSGIFFQSVVAPDKGLLAGLEGGFPSPVSRHSEIRAEDLPAEGELTVRVRSRQSGLCLVEDWRRRLHCFFNHLEYDADSLLGEYRRDLAAGLNPTVPLNYLPGDNPARRPLASWRPAASRFYANWLALVAAEARDGRDTKAAA